MIPPEIEDSSDTEDDEVSFSLDNEGAVIEITDSD